MPAAQVHVRPGAPPELAISSLSDQRRPVKYAECSQFDGQCKCPEGWSGVDCLTPRTSISLCLQWRRDCCAECGSLKDGHQRLPRKGDEDCRCDEGWTGLNCNGSSTCARCITSNNAAAVCENDKACIGFPLRSKDGTVLPTLADDNTGPNMTCFRNGPTVINNHYMCDVTSAHKP